MLVDPQTEVRIGLGLVDEKRNRLTYALFAAGLLSISCLFSYIAVRREPEASRFEDWADRIFLAGLCFLVVSVFIVGIVST